jgi:hypothetical protein
MTSETEEASNNTLALTQMQKMEMSDLGIFLMHPSQLDRHPSQRALDPANVKILTELIKTKSVIAHTLMGFLSKDSPPVPPDAKKSKVPIRLDWMYGANVTRGGHRTEALRGLQAKGLFVDETFAIRLLSDGKFQPRCFFRFKTGKQNFPRTNHLLHG